jgi:hypothetical protein
MSRGAVLVGGVTLGSPVALLIRTGVRNRCAADATSRSRSFASRPEPTREDLLELYRLAAAV